MEEDWYKYDDSKFKESEKCKKHYLIARDELHLHIMNLISELEILEKVKRNERNISYRNQREKANYHFNKSINLFDERYGNFDKYQIKMHKEIIKEEKVKKKKKVALRKRIKNLLKYN